MIIDVRQRAVILNAINDYNFIKEEIEQRIKKVDNLEELSTFIVKFKGTEITNLESYEEYAYLDFIYEDVNMCVCWDLEKGTYVGKTFEIFDKDNNGYVVEDFLSIEEYEKMLNTPKEQMLKDAVADLKFFERSNCKENYDIQLDKIVRFLKEEF